VPFSIGTCRRVPTCGRPNVVWNGGASLPEVSAPLRRAGRLPTLFALCVARLEPGHNGVQRLSPGAPNAAHRHRVRTQYLFCLFDGSGSVFLGHSATRYLAVMSGSLRPPGTFSAERDGTKSWKMTTVGRFWWCPSSAPNPRCALWLD
jgi:hypothetical protein